MKSLEATVNAVTTRSALSCLLLWILTCLVFVFSFFSYFFCFMLLQYSLLLPRFLRFDSFSMSDFKCPCIYCIFNVPFLLANGEEKRKYWKPTCFASSRIHYLTWLFSKMHVELISLRYHFISFYLLKSPGSSSNAKQFYTDRTSFECLRHPALDSPLHLVLSLIFFSLPLWRIQCG